MKKALFVDNGIARRVLLLKSDIKGHERHTVGGKVVFVKPHQDKRTKKQDAGKKPKGFKPGHGGGAEDRSGWEDAVYQAIEATGITRTDAQSVVEAREELFDSLFEDGASPQEAAKAILAASQSAAKTSAK